MKKLLSIIIILLIGIIMVLTRPSKEENREAMLKVVKEYVDEETSRAIGINLFGRVGSDILVRTMGVLLDTQLKENNYYFFNTTSVYFKGKEQMLSVGLFGHVFTFDKEMLREKLEPALKGDISQ